MSGHIDLGGVTPSRFFFPIAFVLGLLFAMISPDADKGWALVLLQWQLQTLLPMALLVGAHMLLENRAGFAGLNSWLALGLSGLLGASLFAPLALAIDYWLEPGEQALSLGRELFAEWLAVAPPVVITWLALNAPWVLGFRLQRIVDAVPPDAQGDVAALPEFINLLPEPLRARPLLLKAELHYLKVVTENGSGLVLYNLGDAIAALPGSAGIAVHRSYWVAFDAVRALERRGRQGELILHGGERVPVSRNRLAVVVEALAERGVETG